MRIKFLATLSILLLTKLSFGQTVLKKTIYFEFNASSIDKVAKQTLDTLIQQLKSQTNFSISLSGNTDDIGSNSYNDSLSNQRNLEVEKYFTLHSIDKSKIRLNSFGETNPAALNNSDRNRSFNRRVEILISFTNANSISSPQTISSSNQQTKDSTVTVKKDNGILISYGSSSVGEINLTTISNTKEMEANNFTTMTTDGEPLTSNLMVCWTLKPNSTGLKEPIKIRVPATYNPYCRVPDVKYYNSQKDSISGSVKWLELTSPGWESETIDGVEYFIITITAADPNRRCANMDCKKLKATHGELKLATKKYRLTSVKVIYESANALLEGTEKSKNLWDIQYFGDPKISSPTIKVTAIDKKGNKYFADLIMKDLTKDKKGNFIVKKSMLKKTN